MEGIKQRWKQLEKKKEVKENKRWDKMKEKIWIRGKGTS